MGILDNPQFAQVFEQHDEAGLAQLIAELEQRPWDADTLRLGRAIAAYEDQRGWKERAEARYRRLLARAQAEQPDSPAVAELYLDLAEMAERWGESMIRPLEKSQPIVKRWDVWSLEARQYRLNGLFACQTGTFDAAQIALEKSQALYEQHQDPEGEAQALNGLAFLAIHCQKYKDALDFLKRAITRDRKHRSHKVGGDLMMNFGYVLRRLYKDQGNAEALQYYRQAAAIHGLRRDPLGYAQACASLEVALAALGDQDEALAALQSGFARLFEAHLLDRGGVLFNNYAVLCAQMGQSAPGLAPVRPYVERWLEDFTRLATDPAAPTVRVEQYAKSFSEVAKVLDGLAGREILERVMAFFNPGRSAHPGAVSWVCTPLLSKGADPLPLLDPLASALEAQFPFLLDYLQACRDLQTDWIIRNPGRQEEDLGFFEQAAAQHMPAIQQVGSAARGLARSLSVVIGRSLAARQTLRSRPDFLPRLEQVARLFTELETLAEILQVLDGEDLIVFRPAMRRGYRVRFSGVADNFQLHTLLAAALVGPPVDGWLPGEPPDPRVVEAARSGPVTASTPAALGTFNLLSWRALLSGGQLSDDVETWVWNEGKPADIPCFEGTRVLLLASPPYTRTWNAGRRYPMLHADLQVVEVLSPGQVDEWLDRILKGIEGEG